MTEKSEQTPEWVDKIWDYLREKPYKYGNFIDGSFAFGSPEKNDEGFLFRIGFLFSDAVCPEQMRSNLNIYEIVRDVAKSEFLDLIRLETGHEELPTPTLYQENVPLEFLAIGYFGRKPNHEEIDRVFSSYDTIEARLKE